MIALLASAAAIAAEVLSGGDALTLDDVVESVVATHPLLEAQRARRDVAEADVLAANGAFDPTLAAGASTKPGKYDVRSATTTVPLGTAWGGKLEVGWQYGVGEFAPYEGALETGPDGEWLVSAALPLLRDAWTDRRRASLGIARAGRSVAEADLAQRELELARSAGNRFLDWVVAGQRLAVARRMVAVARARDDAFAEQERIGEISPFARLDNRRLLVEREDRVVAAARALDQAGIELSTWLRDDDGRPLRPGEALLPATLDPAVAPVDDPVAIALDRRPELARLDAQRDQLALERRLQANQALPALGLAGKLTTPVTSGEEEVVVGIGADWSVAARAARGRREAADAHLSRLAAERRFAEDRIRADVQDALSAAEAARARAELARELVEVARAVEAGERERLALGDSNLLFLNQRELATAEAELSLVDALAATQRAALDLRWATGTLVDGAPGR